MLPAYINEIDNKVIFTGDGELIYYVPEKYFEINIAVINGEYVELMGIFPYCVFDENGKAGPLKQFKCPTIFTCIPTAISKSPKLHLEGTREEKAYRLLHFSKGAELICSTKIPKDVTNVEKFVKLLTGANLPDNIPYNELYQYMIENAELNGFNYKVSNQIIGMIISELCRDPKNLNRPFRLTKMDDMTSYRSINIKQVPKYTSVYTAITSENPDEAIAAAMINTGKGESPLEKVMMN